MGFSRVGTEFLVNTTTAGGQYESRVATLADGSFVVTWTDASQTGGDTSLGAVRGQIFAADGSKSGGEFLVNTTTASAQGFSSVTGLSDGRFVVTWTDASQTGGDTSDSAVRGQIFAADGSKDGGEFLVNTATAGFQIDSRVSSLDDGRFVVTWTDSNSPSGVRAQIFAADGSKSGGELPVSNQVEGRVVGLSDGRFVVTWTDFSQTGGDTSDTAVRGQIFLADGSKSGGEFLVNTATVGNQDDSSVTALTNGGFVVTWTDNEGNLASLGVVRGQVFAADGSKIGSEFLIDPPNQFDSSVTALADGRFVVTWTDSNKAGGNRDVHCQVFAADGSKSGSWFVVNSTTAGEQDESSVTALSDGRFVVTWSDSSQTGGDTSDRAVRAQIFDPTRYDGDSTNETVTGGTLADTSSALAAPTH